jgi:hypothetical protein
MKTFLCLPRLRTRRSNVGAAAFVSAALLVAGGCASTGAGSAGGSRDEITREQLLEMPQATAFDVVRRLRGRWLRPRGAGTSMQLDASNIVVYVNDQREPGGINALRSFRAGALQSIEYFDSSRATTRWGTGHPAGAIVLSLL